MSLYKTHCIVQNPLHYTNLCHYTNPCHYKSHCNNICNVYVIIQFNHHVYGVGLLARLEYHK